MDDVRAVMDAAGSQRAALVGVSEGGPLSALFAATYPARTAALIMIGGYASAFGDDPNDPRFRTRAEWDALIEATEAHWGEPIGLKERAPSRAADPAFRQWWATYLRMSASPGAARALTQMNMQIDVRRVLPTIHVPTLVLHARGDMAVRAAAGRYMAELVPNARFVELPSADHLPWLADGERTMQEIKEFLTGEREAIEHDRVLATVLFTDMVDSTDRASQIGDRRWRELIEAHHMISVREIGRFRGRAVKNTGDGFLAAFDGPARAIRCARALVESLREIGIDIRAGLHTGECEMIGDDLGGIAVHTGARVSALAGAGEVLVSSTVKDLVAGSGIEFSDRGEHQLKGLPDAWRIYAVESA
jgi:class 3 adenylate cyclase